jgi:hypothetical protein
MLTKEKGAFAPFCSFRIQQRNPSKDSIADIFESDGWLGRIEIAYDDTLAQIPLDIEPA